MDLRKKAELISSGSWTSVRCINNPDSYFYPTYPGPVADLSREMPYPEMNELQVSINFFLIRGNF